MKSCFKPRLTGLYHFDSYHWFLSNKNGADKGDRFCFHLKCTVLSPSRGKDKDIIKGSEEDPASVWHTQHTLQLLLPPTAWRKDPRKNVMLKHPWQCYGTENGTIPGLYVLQISVVFDSVGSWHEIWLPDQVPTNQSVRVSRSGDNLRDEDNLEAQIKLRAVWDMETGSPCPPSFFRHAPLRENSGWGLEARDTAGGGVLKHLRAVPRMFCVYETFSRS